VTLTLNDILAELRRRDIRVWADGERLRCDAPPGALTEEISSLLRQHKPGILEFLRLTAQRVNEQRAIVPLQPLGERVPVFAVGGHNGDIYCYRLLAAELGTDQPFFGLQPPGIDEHSEPLERIEELARYFADQIAGFHAGGPCIVAGYCAGGTIAFELARRLHGQGVPVQLLALFAAPHPDRYRTRVFLRERLENGYARVTKLAQAMTKGSVADRRAYLRRKLRDRAARLAEEEAASRDPVLARRAKVEDATLVAASRYHAGFFPGRLCLFVPVGTSAKAFDMPQRWRETAEQVEELAAPIGCVTENMLKEPHVGTIAALFRRCCEPG